jgi:cyclophilin family peptidyl-prolyl cis-trans isomerase
MVMMRLLFTGLLALTSLESPAAFSTCMSRRIESTSLSLSATAATTTRTTTQSNRRAFLNSNVVVAAAAAIGLQPAQAAPAPTITDKIYFDIKGLSPTDPPQRITIGLFGNDAPDATNKLKQLVTKQGLPAPCKPKDTTRLLQKEQLEASKVYNGCKESEDRGVNYDLSTIWRVVKDERIDVGAVSGKFISRENVDWTGTNDLKHDSFGTVSVRRGTDSGFGFTIYPGSSSPSSNLDETNLVVGIVMDGIDTIQQINQVGVVRSAKLGGVDQKAAPSRSCRYGSNELYCNENKPLQKLTIFNSGVL